jgi:hypothetical protein
MRPRRLRRTGFMGPGFLSSFLTVFLCARRDSLASRRLVGIERHQRSWLIRWEFLAYFACGF